MSTDENSKRTRVEPVFGWLTHHAGLKWPGRLLEISDGLGKNLEPGALVGPPQFEDEVEVPASGPSILDPWVNSAKPLASTVDRESPAHQGSPVVSLPLPSGHLTSHLS